MPTKTSETSARIIGLSWRRLLSRRSSPNPTCNVAMLPTRGHRSLGGLLFLAGLPFYPRRLDPEIVHGILAPSHMSLYPPQDSLRDLMALPSFLAMTWPTSKDVTGVLMLPSVGVIVATLGGFHAFDHPLNGFADAYPSCSDAIPAAQFSHLSERDSQGLWDCLGRCRKAPAPSPHSRSDHRLIPMVCCFCAVLPYSVEKGMVTGTLRWNGTGSRVAPSTSNHSVIVYHAARHPGANAHQPNCGAATMCWRREGKCFGGGLVEIFTPGLGRQRPRCTTRTL